jgi:hypothetical protein
LEAQTTFKADPEELAKMLRGPLVELLGPIARRLQELEVSTGSKKHAYTVAEVASMIGYCKRKVLEFINVGRKDRNGKIRKLPKHEITTNEYRILPHELDAWLAHF